MTNTAENAYKLAHHYVREAKGAAKTKTCRFCGGSAQQWAYDGLDENAVTIAHRTFSENTGHYFPACLSCHKRYDIAVRRGGRDALPAVVALLCAEGEQRYTAEQRALFAAQAERQTLLAERHRGH
ncbi:hypothetical protein ACFO9E_28740 [Streptomyces maoxianensis]|uniref:HNH endonuclease n=1 Tax=Streptomyces maoxianensis TaxID=1459942 RepID=A0ABV9GF15_9ACTN